MRVSQRAVDPSARCFRLRARLMLRVPIPTEVTPHSAPSDLVLPPALRRCGLAVRSSGQVAFVDQAQ